MNQLVSGLAPMHPGELLREDILPALNKPKAEIARLPVWAPMPKAPMKLKT